MHDAVQRDKTLYVRGKTLHEENIYVPYEIQASKMHTCLNTKCMGTADLTCACINVFVDAHANYVKDLFTFGDQTNRKISSIIHDLHAGAYHVYTYSMWIRKCGTQQRNIAPNNSKQHLCPFGILSEQCAVLFLDLLLSERSGPQAVLECS
jgi:hypothetical protein